MSALPTLGRLGQLRRAQDQEQLRVLMTDDWGEHAKSIAKQYEDRVLLIGPVPHGWLFPRCAAVVHHGGAGENCRSIVSYRLHSLHEYLFRPVSHGQG